MKKEINKKNLDIKIKIQSAHFEKKLILTPELIMQAKYPEKALWSSVREVFEKEFVGVKIN